MSPAFWLYALAVLGVAETSAGATTAKAPVALSAPAPEAKSFLDEPSKAQPDRPRSVAQAVGMALVVGLMAVGGCVAYGWAHNRRGPKVAGDKINLLAYKALGGRQRLALVEVCGERLLLSANEREVTLLSHLPGAPEAEMPEEAGAESRAEAMAEATTPVVAATSERGAPMPPAPQTVAALEQALAQRDESSSHQAEPLPEAYSADLAGLHRWQAHAQAERRA